MKDYKRKYEEALENLKKIRNSNENNKELVDFIEYKYPEIKESEDEKIKKTLINFLDDVWHLGKNANFDKYGKADCAEWIAWLEKQKDYEDELEKAYKTADEVQYRKWYEDAKREFEKQGEQKVAKFMTKSYITPNPEFFQWIYNRLVYQHHENPNMDYMLSLKERIEDMQEIINVKTSDVLVKQNPAWSEEDEKMLNYTISTVKLHLNDVGSDKKEISLVKEEIDWLKSLKERMKGE